MNKKNLYIVLIGFFCICTNAYAKDYGSELISGCAAIQLKSCKMINRTIKSEQLSKYEKAFNCIKNGSTSGDNFDIGIPLPDSGMLGLEFGSHAKYSTETCKDEIKKLDSANFLKEYSETFDKECGLTLSGQYQQCVEAASRINDSNKIQSFQCSAVQSANQIIINTKYVPGAGDGPEQYKIKSIKGINGISCEDNIYAGINQYSSLSCSLPNNYQTAQLVLKLGNGVTCAVPVQTEPKLEIGMAKKFTCFSIYNSVPDTGFAAFLKNSPLLTATMVGLCDMCLTENINTPDYDQRTLSKRVAGCAVWALVGIAEANAQVCSVKASTNPGITLGGYGEYGGISFGTHDTPPPPILPTAPGTERDKSFYLRITSAKNSDEIAWSKSLCNGRKEGEIIQLHGEEWKDIPIDYANSKEAKEPKFKKAIDSIESLLK